MASTEEEIAKFQPEQTCRLLSLAQAGDRSAADELLKLHRPLLFNYLRKKARTDQDAEDLTQCTLFIAFKNISSYGQRGSFSAWLFGIAGKLVKNYYDRVLRKQDKIASLDALAQELSFEVKQPEGLPCPYKSVEAGVYVESLLEAMHKAGNSAKERNVMVLHYQQESYKDISLLLNISVNDVRLHFFRGRAKLLAYLVEHDPELLGGEDAISAAWEAACQAPDDSKRPNPDEKEAWQKKTSNGQAEMFRCAVIKMAQYLPLSVILLFLLLGANQ